MAVAHTHPSSRHRTGAPARATNFMPTTHWWFVHPLTDLAAALAVLGSLTLMVDRPMVPRTVPFVVVPLVWLLWVILLVAQRRLQRPHRGFPNGLPKSTRSRLRQISVLSLSVLTLVGITGLLVSDSDVTVTIAVVAVLSLVRGLMLLLRLRRLHPMA